MKDTCSSGYIFPSSVEFSSPLQLVLMILDSPQNEETLRSSLASPSSPHSLTAFTLSDICILHGLARI